MANSSSLKESPASAGIAESQAPAPGPPQERNRARPERVSLSSKLRRAAASTFWLSSSCFFRSGAKLSSQAQGSSGSSAHTSHSALR